MGDADRGPQVTDPEILATFAKADEAARHDEDVADELPISMELLADRLEDLHERGLVEETDEDLPGRRWRLTPVGEREADVPESAVGTGGGNGEASFTVTGFSGDSSAAPGDVITAEATVTNDGDAAGETTVFYSFSGGGGKTTTVELDPGEGATVRFRYNVGVNTSEGTYTQTIEADGSSASGRVHVEGEVAEPYDEIPWYSIVLEPCDDVDASDVTCPTDAIAAETNVSGGYGATVLTTLPREVPADANESAGRTGQVTVDNSTSESRAVRSLDLTSVNETHGEVHVNVRYETAVYGAGASVRVAVVGEENQTVVLERPGEIQSTSTESADVSQFAGQEVSIHVVARGDATLRVDEIEVERDSDGDGIRDTAEIATQREYTPIYYVVEDEEGHSLNRSQDVQLDPFDADTNGDGLSDGEQMSFAVERDDSLEGSDAIPGYRVELEGAVAHPNKGNTDGVGLTDAEEIEAGSNPKIPERVMISVKFPVRAEESSHDEIKWAPDTIGDQYLLAPVDKWPISTEDSDRPSWLPEEVEIDEGYTYYKLPIAITINHRGIESSEEIVPDHVTINTESPNNDVQIVDGNMGLHIFENLEEG